MKHRKDPKGNALRDGEGYIKEENGKIRYRYRYQDSRTGKQICFYAKTLDELRIKEKRHEKEIEQGVIRASEGYKMLLNEAFTQYLKTKQLAGSTKANYISIWKNIIADGLGMRPVGTIKQSDIKVLYAKLSKKGYSNSFIKEIHSMLRPIFEMLYQDDIIVKNPATMGIREYGYSVKEKKALTNMEQEIFLDFVKNSNTYQAYYYMLQIAFETGLRAGELLGLRWPDVDMGNRMLSVNHQLIYKNYGDGYKFHIEFPKSDSGKRNIPMSNKVYDAFQGQRKQCFKAGVHCLTEIEGYGDFVFLTRNGNPMMPNAYNNVLYNIVNSQNKVVTANKLDAKTMLPHISSHTLRHTACTRMAERGIDPKVLQYIMGHASVGITMEVYNHITEIKRVETEMKRIEVVEDSEEKKDKQWIIVAGKE